MKSIMLKIQVMSMLLNVVLMPISSALAVIFGYICLISSALLPMELIRYKGNHVRRKQFLIIFTFVIIIILNSWKSFLEIQNEEMENVMKSCISFFSFTMSICVGGISYRENDLKFYFQIVRLFSIVFILYTILPFGFQYTTIGKYGYQQFTLSMGNPNATATKILFCITILVIEVGIINNVWVRRSDIVLILCLLYTIIKLESRTALLCALTCIVSGILLKVKVKKWMINMVWIIPLAFIPVQILFQEISMLEFMNKSLASGRDTLFSEFINQIKLSPLSFILGDFGANQLSNCHNIIFTLVYNFGFVGTGLYFVFWKNENERFKASISNVSNYAWLGWLVFVIHSMAEAAPMSGAFTFAPMIIVLNRMTKDRMLVIDGSEIRYDLEVKTYIKDKNKVKYDE